VKLAFCGKGTWIDVKSLVNLSDETEDRNGGKLLLTISVGFELLERLLENEVGNSGAGNTYEDGNDDGNTDGNTDVGGWGDKLLLTTGIELELSEKLLGLVKLLELFEVDGVRSNGERGI
jgi:hypothetical protein